MKHIFIAGGLACIALGLVPTAKGAVENEYAYFPFATSPYPPTTEGVTQFDSSLGTLNSVTFLFTESVSGSAFYNNTSSSAETLNSITQYQSLSVADPSLNYFAYNASKVGQNLLTSGGTQPPGVTDNGGRPETWTVNPGASATVPVSYSQNFTYTLSPSSTVDSSSYPLSSSGTIVMGEFVGSGSVNLKMNSIAEVIFDGGADLSYSSTIDTAGTMDVQYNYTPTVVPEPGTWMAAGLLCGVMVLHTGRSLWRRKIQPVA